ncbi:uncharacterized protein LOC9629430 [Selaginella moellendorffii]|nr:uncharacterized protein LOC9629430 [Selaginella moellendorffii]|eukprot:XP_002975304.2 uncharacterized protein LOC9629430 [Selaginella moellendorffii]
MESELLAGRAMATAATAGAAVSLAAAAPRSRSLTPGASNHQLRNSFLGSQLCNCDARLKVSHPGTINSTRKTYNPLQVEAKTAAGKTIEVEVDKPLGLSLGQKPGGGVIITAVEGNAARAGLKVGDQVLYTSSFFGDELWPADKLGFTKTAIQAKPESVYFVVSRGADVDVKRLPKRPAPPRFGRKLTEAQKARATHICLDCGYVYTLSKPFEEQPDGFLCPQCRAPKKRFSKYDPETGRAVGGGALPISVILGVLAGALAVGGLVVYGLQ